MEEWTLMGQIFPHLEVGYIPWRKDMHFPTVFQGHCIYVGQPLSLYLHTLSYLKENILFSHSVVLKLHKGPWVIAFSAVGAFIVGIHSVLCCFIFRVCWWESDLSHKCLAEYLGLCWVFFFFKRATGSTEELHITPQGPVVLSAMLALSLQSSKPHSSCM